MPNIIDNTGIKVKTRDEIITSIVDGDYGAPGLKQIYGDDINIDSDTPDGQLVNIFALAVKDTLDLAVQVFNSFDPDFAVGRILDQRCAINGIERQGATYTETLIAVKTNRAVTLPGLDKSTGTPFTVSDSEGNKFQLKTTTTVSPPDPGNEPPVFMFRAAESGSIRCLPDTIIRQVTITPGVVSVNNPSPPTILGVDEESDYDLRIRRARALSLPAVGTIDGILSSVIDTSGVSEAIVYENTSNEIDDDGIPGHSVWCIVEGGTDADVARAIYIKRNAGCGMKGEVFVDIKQEDGTDFRVRFDRPVAQPLWIKFTADTIEKVAVPNAQDLRGALMEKLHYSVNQNADVTTIAKVAREFMPDVVIYNAYVSTTGNVAQEDQWHPIVTPDSKHRCFVLANERIIINGNPGEKIQ